MRTLRSRCLILGLCVVLAAPAFSRAETLEGRWFLDFDRADGRVQLTMKRTSSHGHSTNSSSYSPEDFRGLSLPRGGGTTPARFELVRDAGTVRFEGQLDESGGSGRFQFTASPEFGVFWRSRGNDSLSAEDAYAFTMHDVSRRFLDDLGALGYDRVPAGDLVSMRIHGATPEFIRDLKALGYDHIPVDGLVSLRIHGATPEFIRDLKALGYEHVPADGLVSMRIHGVSPDYVRQLQELGYRRVPIDSLVSMRIHGVSIDYARKMKERHGEISPDELVNMRIHGR